jgi:threonine/homoserine/homoserine lactone efflux protein
MLALGAALPLAVVAAAAVSAGSSSSTLSHDSTVKAALDTGLGALLIALGLCVMLRGPRPPKTRAPREPSLRRAFLLGIAGMATNVSTLALFVPALKLIAAADVAAGAKALAGLVVFALTLSFVLVPLALAAVVPGSARALEVAGSWMTAHRRAISVALMLGFGALLIAKGIAAL